MVANIFLNGMKCATDVDAHVLYCPVGAEAGRPLTARFSTDVPATRILVDGQPLGRDGSVVVDDWQGEHTLAINSGNASDAWQLVFTTLPVVELLSTGTPSSVYSPGTIRIIDPLARTDGQEVSEFSCQLRYRGATSQGYEKKSFAVKLFDADGEDLDANVLGIREENSWILDAAAVDVSRMRNRALFDIWNEMARLPYGSQGRNGTKGDYVELLLNGRYHGLYCLSDKIDRKLLDLKKSTADRTRGLLYKCTTWGGASGLSFYEEAAMDTVVWNAWELRHPEDYPSESVWQPLADLVDFCRDDLRPDEEWLADLPGWFYEENLRQFLVFSMAFHLRDNLFKNTYLSCYNNEVGHRFLFTPWDLDASVGRNWDGKLFDYMAGWELPLRVQPYCRLLSASDSGFLEACASEWYSLCGTTLSPQHVEEVFRDYADRLVVSGAWRRERERWNGNPVELPEEPGEEIDYMMDWYARNCRQMQSLLPVPTGIGQLLTTEAGKREIFGLDGRRMPAAPSRGCYIEDGKKRVR